MNKKPTRFVCKNTFSDNKSKQKTKFIFYTYVLKQMWFVDR